jgi:glycosyltransferase involved in cell wall biosynthesis
MISAPEPWAFIPHFMRRECRSLGHEWSAEDRRERVDKLSITVPIYNEQDNIRPLYEALNATLSDMGGDYELIMVNDGSQDRSEAILDQLAESDKRLKVIHFCSNYGQTYAMMAGIAHASGDIIVALDGDNQNDPQDIPLLLEKIEAGYDVVSGWRKERKDRFLTRTLPSIFANRLISLISGVRLHDYGCSLKAYRKEVIRDLRLYGEMHRFIPIYASWFGAKVAEVVVRHHPRRKGRSNYGISRVWAVVLDLILVRFFDKHAKKPFHLFGGFGLVSFLLSLVTFLAMIYYKYWGGKSFIETPLPILTVFFLLIGFVAIFIGFMAEMLMRTYYESQDRHPYLIKKIIN